MATVTVNVLPENDSPVGNDDGVGTPYQFLEDDLTASISVADLLANDLRGADSLGGELANEAGQELFVTDIQPDDSGNITVQLVGQEVLVTPVNPHWFGTATFTYQLIDDGDSNGDGLGESEGEAQEAPAAPDAINRTTVNVEFLKVNDEPQSINASVNMGPTPIDPNRELLEDVPNQNLVTFDELESLGGPGAVGDPLEPLNQTIQLVSIDGTTSHGGTISIDGVTAPDGVIMIDPSSSGVIKYTPDSNFFGIDSVQYTIVDLESGATPQSYEDDGNGGFSLVDDQHVITRTLTFEVINVNDPPTYVEQDIEALEDRTITIGDGSEDFFIDFFQLEPGPFNEPEGLAFGFDPNTFNASSGRFVDPDSGQDLGHGTISNQLFDATGNILVSFEYTPDPDFFGVDKFDFIVADLFSPPSEEKFSGVVTVRPVNDVPVTADDSINLVEDQVRILPASFFIDNDFVNQPAAGGTFEEETDADNVSQFLRITGVEITQQWKDMGAEVSLSPDGNWVTILPPRNYYSTTNGVEAIAPDFDITYTVEDNGWSFQPTSAVDDPIHGVGGSNADPLTATGTILAKIWPVNDPPETVPHSIKDTVVEDTQYTIPVNAIKLGQDIYDRLEIGDPIPPGYDSAGIGENLGPLGIKQDPAEYPVAESLIQSLSIKPPVINAYNRPLTTTLGGTIVFNQDLDTGEVINLTYTPPPNFASVPASLTDSFSYLVEDNGISYEFDPVNPNDPNGVPREKTGQQLSAFGRVEIEVLPRNDAPEFKVISGQEEIDEDSGLTVVEDYAYEIFAGPRNALDEISGDEAQNYWFEVTLASPVHIEDYFKPLESYHKPDPADTDVSTPVYVEITPDGDLRFEPADDAFGRLDFTVVLRDNGGVFDDGEYDTSLEKSLTIDIAPINDPPTFDVGEPVTVDEDSPLYSQPWAKEISAGPTNEVEIQNQTVVFEVVVDNDDQVLFSLQPQISPDGTLTFIPAEDMAGNATVAVTAVDSEGGRSETVTLDITITEVNDRPEGIPERVNTDEDTIRVFTEAELLANENDIAAPGDPDLITNPDEFLTLVAVSGTTDVGASITFDPVGKTITYDPSGSELLQALSPGESLEDSFTYTVVDAAGLESNPTQVLLHVEGLNDAPMTQADLGYVVAGKVSRISVLDNDKDVDQKEGNLVAILAGPAGFTRVSTVEDHGLDVDDVIRIASNSVADNNAFHKVTHVLSSTDFVTDRRFVGEVGIGGHWGDSPQPSTLQIEVPPVFGIVDINDQGVVSYYHFGDTPANDLFSYTVADALGERSQETFVQINVNESPTALNDEFVLYVDESSTVDVLANDSDVDGDVNPDSLVIVTEPEHGLLIPTANGELTYYPEPGFIGQDSFQYQVSDQLDELSNIATAVLHVRASRLQNPVLFTDVNADGVTSALDALLIINRLSEENSSSIIQVTIDDSAITEEGLRYYDVNGSKTITALDALNVINELARVNNQAGPSGEQVILDSTGVIDFSVDYRVEEANDGGVADIVGDALLYGEYEPSIIQDGILGYLLDEHMTRRSSGDEEIVALDAALTLMKDWDLRPKT